MRAHPAAALFPMMSAAELDALAEDIKAHGQRHPITLFRDGSILDGRNRYEACNRAKVKPHTEQFTGNESEAVAFVVSVNLHRRNLTEQQRAFIAAGLANMRREDTLVPAARQHKQAGESLVPPDGGSRPLISAREAAKAMDVSKRSVERARAVQMHAPDLKDKVLSEEMTLSHAADIAAERAKEKREDDPPRAAPKRPTKAPKPTLGPPRDGMQFARMAVLQLEQIREDDSERSQAFAFVREWIDAREA